MARDQVNILLVDDQSSKLLTYDVILRGLGENLITADPASSAFKHLLKGDVAVVLLDVCMPELDGIELAKMIREHPRCRKTAIILTRAFTSVTMIAFAAMSLVRSTMSRSQSYPRC